jgi:MFS family permease
MAAFVIMGLNAGIAYSFGVFFMPVLNEFNWSRGLMSGNMFMLGLGSAVGTPLSGWLADKFGFRPVMVSLAGLLGLAFILTSKIQTLLQFYLLNGLLVGLTAGVFWALPVSLVSRWFIRRQGMALGIATSGIGVGTIIMPLLLTHLIYNYGWRISYIVCGLLVWLVCVPVSWFVMHRPAHDYLMIHEGGHDEGGPNSGAQTGHQGDSLSKALSSRVFWLLYIVYGIIMLSIGVITVHLVPYALDQKMPAMWAAGLLTVIGAGSIFGRLLSGIAADRVGSKAVLICCLALQAVVIVWLVYTVNVWMFYVFAVLFGFSYGGFIPLMPKLTSDVFGPGAMGAIFGFLMTSDSIGWGAGPWLAGYLFDRTNSYTLSFVAVIGAILLAIIFTLFLKKPTTVVYAE